jgi:hypothetical protein
MTRDENEFDRDLRVRSVFDRLARKRLDYWARRVAEAVENGWTPRQISKALSKELDRHV